MHLFTHKADFGSGLERRLTFDFVSCSISSCDCRLGFAHVLQAYLFRVAAVGRGHLEAATCGLQAQQRNEVLKGIKMDLKVV